MKVSLLSYKYPQLDGPKTGVFAKIAHHDANHNERNFETNYMESYLRRFKDFTPKTIENINNEGTFAGTEIGKKVNERIKITTELVGEKYKNYNEPKENTSVRRCWLYKQDPSIIEAEKNLLNDKSNASSYYTSNNSISLGSTVYSNMVNNNDQRIRDNYERTKTLYSKENPCLKDRMNQEYLNNNNVFLNFNERSYDPRNVSSYKKSDINKTTVKPYNLRAYPWETQNSINNNYIVNQISKA